MIPLDLTIKIKTLPESAGVYKFFNKKSTIIYIGKAKNLKRRLILILIKITIILRLIYW